MFPGFDLYYADPAHPLTTARVEPLTTARVELDNLDHDLSDLYDLDDDLSDLSVRGVVKISSAVYTGSTA